MEIAHHEVLESDFFLEVLDFDEELGLDGVFEEEVEAGLELF